MESRNALPNGELLFYRKTGAAMRAGCGSRDDAAAVPETAASELHKARRRAVWRHCGAFAATVGGGSRKGVKKRLFKFFLPSKTTFFKKFSFFDLLFYYSSLY